MNNDTLDPMNEQAHCWQRRCKEVDDRDNGRCDATRFATGPPLPKTAGQSTKQPVLRQFVVIESVLGRRQHPPIWIGRINAGQSGEPASEATRRVRRKPVAWALPDAAVEA